METISIEALAHVTKIPAEDLARYIRRREQETGIELVHDGDRVHLERTRQLCGDLWQGGHQPATVADVRGLERRVDELERIIRDGFNRLEGRSGFRGGR